jgi:hypothetical protein
MTSKKFLQFWKEMKIRQPSRGRELGMKQDSENKASNFCWCSHTCVTSNTHVEAEHAPCRTRFSKSCFLLPYRFTVCKVLMVLPVGVNSEYSTPLTSQTIVGMILTADTAVLNISVLVILCDWTPLTTSYSEWYINLSPMMIFLKNSPVSRSRHGRNCWLTSICFYFILVGTVVEPILRANFGSRIGIHCRQSFASDAHFVRSSLMRNEALFLFASSKRFRWALSVALRGLSFRC